MELTSAQRKIAFAVIVVALAGLGLTVFRPAAQGSRRGSVAPARPAASAASASPLGQGTPAASPDAGSGGQAGQSAPSATAVPDIYSWLPFTPPQLAIAAGLAVKFADHYETFSYSETATGYLAPMRAQITGQLALLLARAYSTPGVASERTARKQVSTGTAVISSLRAFGPSSLTFIVAITQQITDTRGRSQSTADFAITVSNSGGWQVSDIEPASAGNS
jgi:hypothetical protein